MIVEEKEQQQKKYDPQMHENFKAKTFRDK